MKIWAWGIQMSFRERLIVSCYLEVIVEIAGMNGRPFLKKKYKNKRERALEALWMKYRRGISDKHTG